MHWTFFGDAGYASKVYLLTPLASPVSLAENKYQKAYIKTRNLIERTFGAWKAKFFCLQTKLRLKLSTSLSVIVACAVLWNFIIKKKKL